MLRLMVLVCLTCCMLTQATAQPTLTIGLKATRGMAEEFQSFMSGTFNLDVYREMYWGIGGDLLLNFTRWFTLKFELCEFKYLDHGGTNLEMLSNINTDAMFFIPTSKRISPLVYVGFRYGRFWNTDPHDYRSFDPVYELRAGLGAQYRLPRKCAIFVEIELYSRFQSKLIRVPMEDMIYSVQSEYIGVNEINVGTRINL